MSKRIVIAPDRNGDDQIQFWEDNVLQGTLRMYDLTFLFSRPINDGGKYSTRDVLNNTSEDVNIGDKRYDRAYFIDYVVERGTSYQAGELIVVNDETSGPFQYSHRSAGANVGITFEFTVDENSIIMTATTTDTGEDAILKITTKTIGR